MKRIILERCMYTCSGCGDQKERVFEGAQVGREPQDLPAGWIRADISCPLLDRHWTIEACSPDCLITEMKILRSAIVKAAYAERE